MGGIWGVAVVLLLLAGTASAQPAERRVALVIGNGQYQYVPRLANPANDAQLIAETLMALSFTLVGGKAQLDLDKTAFDRIVREFSTAIQGAGVALFYYAGHGLQVRGANYLAPVSANPTREADVDFQLLNVDLVLRQMELAGTRLNFLILDACRNNPFAGRGLRATDGGLAQMQAPEGTLIAYATQPGHVALDGTDGQSPYTRALANAFRKPGLDVFAVFNETGLEVKKRTGGAQQPWVASSPIEGQFYFSGAPVSQLPGPTRLPPATTGGTVSSSVSPTASDMTALDFYRSGNAKVDVQDYPAALRDFTQVITLDPQNAKAYYNRGNAYVHLKDYPAALRDFTQVIALDPNNAKAYYNRGNAYMHLEDDQAALADFTQVIALDPNNAKAYYNRGNIHVRLKDAKAALADYRKAADLYQQQGEPSAYHETLNHIKALQR